MLALVASGLALAATGSPTAGAASIAPTIVPGNPRCSDLGYPNGFKVDGAPAGTFALSGLAGANVTIANTTADGRSFDWSSDFGLDAVLVKGGDQANLYAYANDASGDTRLNAPVNSSGSPAAISHIEFCYDDLGTSTVTRDVSSVEGARGVAVADIPLTSLPANLANLVAGTSLVNDAGTGLRFSGTGLRFSGTGLRFSGTGLRFSGTGLRFSGTSLRFSGTGLRFSGTGLRFSGTGLRFSATGVGLLDGLRSAGTGLRFSGTGLRFSDLPAWQVTLADLQAPAGFEWSDVLAEVRQVAGIDEALDQYPLQNVTLAQVLDRIPAELPGSDPSAYPALSALAAMSLLDLDPHGALLRDLSLVALMLGATPLSALAAAAGTTACALTGEAPGPEALCSDPATSLLLLNLFGLTSDQLPLGQISLDALAPALDPASVLADLLTDGGSADPLFVPSAPGQSLAHYILEGIDALNVPWEELPLRDPSLDLARYALGQPVTFTVELRLAATSTTSTVLTSPVPARFAYADGSPSCTTTSGSCNVVAQGDQVTVTTSGPPALRTVTVRLVYRPVGLITGSPNQSLPSGAFTIQVADRPASEFTVAVTDPFTTDPPSIDPDVLYFGSVAASGLDRYDVPTGTYAPGSHVAVRLSSMNGDGDLVLYRSAGTGLRFSGTGMRFSGTGLRFSGTGLRFSGEGGDRALESLEPETLEDVPIEQDELVESVSANRDTVPEAVDGFTGDDTSTFRVQVSGFNQTSTDYVLRVAVTEFGDACTSGTPAAPTITWATRPTNPDTVVLYPRGRFAAADQALIDAALARLGSRAQIGHIVGGTDWTSLSGYCSVEAANAYAIAVGRALTDAQQVPASVQYVVVVGGDDKIPYYRSPDTAVIANESDYASTIGGANVLADALATQHLLTDDVYGDLDPWPWLNRLYFTPERAVGRLVESGADIAGQINRFVDGNGTLSASSALTAGYDFLLDAATEIDDNLGALTPNRTTLISETWTAGQLASALSGKKIASINAHYDQGQLLTAAGNAQLANPPAGEIVRPPLGVLGALLFTVGCHAGLNQPYANAARTDSWAESLAGGAAAVYLANTGFGYGTDDAVAYSEELMAEFAGRIDETSVGLAVVAAKQRYFAEHAQAIDPYAEKSQMQVVLYGLPMYRMPGANGSPTPTSAVGATTIDPQTGLLSAPVSASFTFGGQAGGVYPVTAASVNGVNASTGTLVANGYPIQPEVAVDVTAPGSAPARSFIIEQLTSRSVPLADPAVARAVVDLTTLEPAQESADVIFPTSFASVQIERVGGTPRGRLVIVPGQYDANDVGREQLQITSLQGRVYYNADAQASDVIRPQFRAVSASVDGSDLLFRAAVDDPSDGVNPPTGLARVLVQYFDPATGLWHPVELFPADAARTLWSGGLPGVGTGGVYFVQAVDRAGNGAVTANKGDNYPIGGEAPLAVAFVSGPRGQEGWFTGAATVTLKGSAVGSNTHQVQINGGAPFSYSTPFTLTSEGTNEVVITGTGATPIAFTVPIDTRRPVVSISPILPVIAAGEALPTATCTVTDPVPGSGLSTPTCSTRPPTSVTVGSTTYSIANFAKIDVAGNEGTASQTAVIVNAVKNADGTFSGGGTVTVVAGGALSGQVTFTVTKDGVPVSNPPVVYDGAGHTATLSLTSNGSYGITVTAPGGSGQVSVSVTITVTVTPRYRMVGFFSPVFGSCLDYDGYTPWDTCGATTNAPATINEIKAGSALPFKFRVVDDQNRTYVRDLAFVVAAEVQTTCPAGLPTASPQTTNDKKSSLSYDGPGEQYIRVWKSPNSKGACYLVTATLTGANGGGTLKAYVRLK